MPPNPPPGSNGGTPTAPAGGEVTDVAILQRVAREGLDPYSTAGQARARELMGAPGALTKLSEFLKKYPSYKQIDATHFRDPSGYVHELMTNQTNGEPRFEKYTRDASTSFLNTVGTSGGGGGSSGGGSSAANDQRDYDLALARLAQDNMNMGLDADSARRQAEASLIANRNNLSADVAQTSAGVAKTAAEFAANPRDAVAELMYRNQVGGSTPFGDMTNDNFGAYGKALADKAASIFQPVSGDLKQARVYRDSIPPVDYFGAETRANLGLAPTPAQQLTGASGMSDAPQTAAPVAVNPLQALTDRLQSMSPQEQANFRAWTTAGQGRTPTMKTRSFAEGGQINFDSLYESRARPGFSPSSSEGGTNLNLHERAIVVGESGQVYATLGEKRPDGSVRAEQLQIKPLKSEVAIDKKLEDGKKAVVENQKQTMAAFAGGGTIQAGSSPDDFMEQLRQYLGGLGGSGGGAGAFKTPLPSLRLLAGAPANALEDDPVAQDYALAGYSALGIDPRTVAATIKKFTPSSAQRIGQTGIRTSFA